MRLGGLGLLGKGLCKLLTRFLWVKSCSGGRVGWYRYPPLGLTPMGKIRSHTAGCLVVLQGRALPSAAAHGPLLSPAGGQQKFHHLSGEARRWDVGVRDRRLRSHLLELGTLGIPQHRAHCWGDWGRAPRSSWGLFHRTAGALGDAAQFGSGPKGKTRAQESLMPRELKLP